MSTSQLQKELAKQAELNRALFSQAITCFALFDRSGKIIQVNESYANYYGKRAKELIGRQIYENMSADMDITAARELVEQVIRTKEPLNFENYPYQFVDHPERGITYWDSTVQPLLDENGEVEFVFFSSIDVTKRRRAELALVKAKEAAEHTSKMKSRFLDIAAHELRTPVTAFSTLLQLSEKLLRKSQPVSLSTLQRLSRQADKLAKLVNDLMEVSRLEHGALLLQLEVSDLVELIKACTEDFRLQYPRRRFLFDNPTCSLEISMDTFRINQVLSNIVENSARYTPEDCPIELTLENESDRVRVCVTDHGPGIQKEQQRELFEPFNRGNTGPGQYREGLGLGLYVCRQIIELHHGSIGVFSEPGFGTRFYFELPKGLSLRS